MAVAQLAEHLSVEQDVAGSSPVSHPKPSAKAGGYPFKQDVARFPSEGGQAPVGQRFEAGEFFVAEMLIAARAMQAGLSLLKPHLADSGVGNEDLFLETFRNCRWQPSTAFVV